MLCPSYPEGTLLTARDLVDAQIYPTEQDVYADALRLLLRARPELRLQLAVHRYRTEPISLAEAAHSAGVSWEQMREILLEHGVELRLGPETLDEAREEVRVLHEQAPRPS
jgi:predicted HTH domain antitoxin